MVVDTATGSEIRKVEVNRYAAAEPWRVSLGHGIQVMYCVILCQSQSLIIELRVIKRARGRGLGGLLDDHCIVIVPIQTVRMGHCHRQTLRNRIRSGVCGVELVVIAQRFL